MMKRLIVLSLVLALAFPCALADGGEPVIFTFFQLEGFERVEIGDACLIRFPNGQTLLVDAMEVDCAGTLVKTLRDMGVETLDAVLFTHMHIDHIGGAAAVLYGFPVGALYGPGEPYHTNTYRGYVAAQEATGVHEQTLKTGDTLTFGDVTLTVLHPDVPADVHERFVEDRMSVGDTNQYCVVFRLEYGDFSALFTGDIYQVTEKALVKRYGEALESDLLKIPHHGNDTSSGAFFLDAVKPAIAVAIGNTPVPQWLYKRYLKRNIKTYLTWLDGTVTIEAYADGRAETVTQYPRDDAQYRLQ